MNEEEFYSYVPDIESFEKKLRLSAINNLISFMDVMNSHVDRSKMARDRDGALISDEFLNMALERYFDISRQKMISSNKAARKDIIVDNAFLKDGEKI